MQRKKEHDELGRACIGANQSAQVGQGIKARPGKKTARYFAREPD